uniref:hypothetical protein n=1 Tax=Mariniflexile sp. TaxID=1979402 RepID=UPI004048B7A8
MKKIIVVLSVMLITLSVTAQKKKGKGGNNDCYLSTAVATFNLSEENKVKLNDLFTEKLNELASIKKKIKATEISKEEGKSKSKDINQTYFKNLADLTGKSKKEVMSFEKDTKSKCK